MPNIRSNRRPYSPRSTLTDQTPASRKLEKDALTCVWVSLHGHSVEQIILELLNIKARGICSRLRQAGLLMPVEVPYSSMQAWAVTREGLRFAEMALGREINYLSHPGRLTLSRLTHELLVQREAIARLPVDLPGLRRLRADRELRSMPEAVRPDLQVRHVRADGQEIRIYIELEVSPKSTKDLRTKFLKILPLLTPQTMWCWYISDGRRTCERYSETWFKLVAEHGHGYRMPIERLRAAMVFQLSVAAQNGRAEASPAVPSRLPTTTNPVPFPGVQTFGEKSGVAEGCQRSLATDDTPPA